jgi:hypothetical protein
VFAAFGQPSARNPIRNDLEHARRHAHFPAVQLARNIARQ